MIALIRRLAAVTMCGNCGSIGHSDAACPYPKPFTGDED